MIVQANKRNKNNHGHLPENLSIYSVTKAAFSKWLGNLLSTLMVDCGLTPAREFTTVGQHRVS